MKDLVSSAGRMAWEKKNSLCFVAKSPVLQSGTEPGFQENLGRKRKQHSLL